MKKLITTICLIAGILLTMSADVKAQPCLLLHFDGKDGATSTDDSSLQNHFPINFFGNAQLDTSEKHSGTASLLLDGAGDYLTIPDSPDWDILASNIDSWTIDFWARHDSHSGYEVYLQQYDGSIGRWWVCHQSGGVKFSSYSGPDLPPAAEITDSDWHWITFCKVANQYAIYKDGQQVSFTQHNGTGNYTSPLYIGGYTNGYYLDGHIDELRITHDNLFGANPNQGLTNVITYYSTPEPATICLLGLGSLVFLRRRKE